MREGGRRSLHLNLRTIFCSPGWLASETPVRVLSRFVSRGTRVGASSQEGCGGGAFLPSTMLTMRALPAPLPTDRVLTLPSRRCHLRVRVPIM
jgi:hypothetical protein